MSQSHSPATSHFRSTRSRPAAVALLVLIAALSAPETRHRDDAARDDAGRDEANWSRVEAGTSEAALVASAGIFAARMSDLEAPPDAAPPEAAPPEVATSEFATPASVGQPYPVEYLTVDVDGAPTPLAFRDVSPAGPVNGRAVLILHDHDDAGDAWVSTIGALSADGYRVIVPDQVGHGLSGLSGRELPVGTLAAQAAILLDSIGAPRVAVVGDGLGAEVAVRLAGAEAGLVERMALLPARPPRGRAAPPADATLHDPVLGRPVPVLVVTDLDAIGGARLDALLLGFLGL